MVEVTDADREAAAKWAKMQGRPHQAGNMRRGACDAAPLVQAFARHRIAAEQRGKLEGARLAIAAAAKDAEEWFPFDTSKRYPSFGVVASIRALDPAKIVDGGP